MSWEMRLTLSALQISGFHFFFLPCTVDLNLTRGWQFVSHELEVSSILALSLPCCSLNGRLYRFLAIGKFYFRAFSTSLKWLPPTTTYGFKSVKNPSFLRNGMHFSVAVELIYFPLLRGWYEICFSPMFSFMFSYSFELCFLWQCSRAKDVVSPKDYLIYVYNLKPDNLKVCSLYQNTGLW